MRSVIIAAALALAWSIGVASPAYAVPAHLHCLATPGTTTAIAGGVTANAPHETLERFHSNVHLGAFANNSPSSPVTISATSPTGSCE